MKEIREAFREAFRAALEAVEPERLTFERLSTMDVRPPVTVLALGKAAPGMARGAGRALGDQVAEGVVVSDHVEPVPDGWRLVVGGHPFPDDRSLQAGAALLEAAVEAPPSGTVVVLLSGGGSALAEAPVRGVDLDDLVSLNRTLMEAGVPIEETNLVRRHLSLLKNGGLAAATTARLVTLLISDVVDGPASDVASGPTLPDGSERSDALAVLERRGLTDRVPARVVEALSGKVGRNRAVADDHHWEVLADCATAAHAARDAFGDRAATVATTALRGDAREEALRLYHDTEPGEVLVAAGETTVVVTGSGLGGRNQHAALAVALRAEAEPGVFAAFATDGRDGPTPAAGGIIDAGSAGRMRAAGVDPGRALRDCDSHRALHASGDLVVTGATVTNVGDLWMAWRPR